MIVELLKKSMFFILIGIGLIIFLFVNNDDTAGSTTEFTSNTTPQETVPKSNKNKNEKEKGIAIVDVKGEILHPGVYEISTESRVNDVIQMAGGFTELADETMVNLAQKVQDEMIIIIPKIGEAESTASAGGESESAKRLRINYATQEEIESLNGIGPSKAQAIIQYREENGFFQTVDDLLNVSGIGEKTLENLKNDIQIP